MKRPLTLQALQEFCNNTMVSHLGIEFLEIGHDFISARMPVDYRTIQPMGLLHGGASVALAETLGSIAGNMVLENENQYCVGVSINANHIKSAKSGYVYGKALPVQLSSFNQVWDIKIYNESQDLICVSRLILAVVTKK
jgi:1,4-dihydroxy-2-naphthoyl-CoA hydrolase